jgi:spore coat protein CotF
LEYQQHFSRAQQRGSRVEIIEVAPHLDRGAVGQVVVGAWLLEKQGLKPNMVLVCQEAAPRLRQFLKKHGIGVWSPN